MVNREKLLIFLKEFSSENRPLAGMETERPMNVAWKNGVCALVALLLWTGVAGAQEGPFYLQALVGAASFGSDELTFTSPAANGGSTRDTVDLHQIPYLGLALQIPLAGRFTEAGLEISALGGWRSRPATVFVGENRSAVRVDADFWLLDIAAGFFVRQPIGTRWVGYLAAGPTMDFASYRHDATTVDNPVEPAVPSTHDSAFGLGGYARAGLEYRLADQGFIGVCVRASASNLSFEQTSASGLYGVQGFLTFTRRFY